MSIPCLFYGFDRGSRLEGTWLWLSYFLLFLACFGSGGKVCFCVGLDLFFCWEDGLGDAY